MSRKSGIYLLLTFSALFPQDRDLLGDLNQDGVVDILDIIRAVNIILEIPPDPTEYELWAVDVNVDEEINVGDLVLMVSFILNTIDCPPDNSPCEFNYYECCLDTTSHDFTWAVDTLGNLYSSVRDAWIFSEDHIWVIGEIWSGELGDSELYSGAIWNGNEWELIKLIYEGSGSTLQPHGIWAFAPDDIWFASGSVFHYDGEIITLEW